MRRLKTPQKRNVQNLEKCSHAEQRSLTRQSVKQTETLKRDVVCGHVVRRV